MLEIALKIHRIFIPGKNQCRLHNHVHEFSRNMSPWKVLATGIEYDSTNVCFFTIIRNSLFTHSNDEIRWIFMKLTRSSHTIYLMKKAKMKKL